MRLNHSSDRMEDAQEDAARALATLAEGGLRGSAADAWRLVEAAWPGLHASVAKSLAILRVPTRLREDCGQNAFVRVWDRRKLYRGTSTAELNGWLFRICQREFSNLLRREDGSGRPSLEALLESAEAAQEEAGPDPTAEAIEERDTGAALEHCMEHLKPLQRTVVELIYLEPVMTERAAAAALDRSKAHVHDLKREALFALQRCLERRGIF